MRREAAADAEQERERFRRRLETTPVVECEDPLSVWRRQGEQIAAKEAAEIERRRAIEVSERNQWRAHELNLAKANASAIDWVEVLSAIGKAIDALSSRLEHLEARAGKSSSNDIVELPGIGPRFGKDGVIYSQPKLSS